MSKWGPVCSEEAAFLPGFQEDITEMKLEKQKNGL